MIPFRVLPKFVPGALGDLWYRASNGDLTRLTIPADWETVPYVLRIIDGVPAWVASSELPPASFAWVYMTTVDETGATVLMTDDDGSPILTYAPVA